MNITQILCHFTVYYTSMHVPSHWIIIDIRLRVYTCQQGKTERGCTKCAAVYLSVRVLYCTLQPLPHMWSCTVSLGSSGMTIKFSKPCVMKGGFQVLNNCSPMWLLSLVNKVPLIVDQQILFLSFSFLLHSCFNWSDFVFVSISFSSSWQNHKYKQQGSRHIYPNMCTYKALKQSY